VGEAPACFHTCVGRIRYLGVLLYDGDRIAESAARPEGELVDAHRALVLDPFDPEVVAAGRRSGLPEQILDAARRSPVYRFVKEWGIALPLHPEYRTVPMLFYVPPLLPSMADQAGRAQGDFFTSLERARLPLKYLASLFAAGNERVVEAAYRRLIAVRLHRRATRVGDLPSAAAEGALAQAGLGPAQADEIYRLTALAGMSERIVVPGLGREAQTEPAREPQSQFGAGFGYLRPPPGR
jgi:nitrate reductase beta subunit